MKIYTLVFICTLDLNKTNNEIFIEKIRSNAMSLFSSNKIIDAITTADIIYSTGLISFRFKEPIIIEDTMEIRGIL